MYPQSCSCKCCNTVKIEQQQNTKNPQKRVFPFQLEIGNVVNYTTPPTPAKIEQQPAPNTHNNGLLIFLESELKDHPRALEKEKRVELASVK